MNTEIEGSIVELNHLRQTLLQCLIALLNKRINSVINLEKQSFTSKQVNFRPLKHTDHNFVINLFSDIQVTKHTGGVFSKPKIKRAFYESLKALMHLPIKKHIGILRLAWYQKQIAFAEFGIMFFRDYQNKGYCCQLLENFIEHCFEQYQRASRYSYTLTKKLCRTAYS